MCLRFYLYSGLKANPSKSACFFANVPVGAIHAILEESGFQWGELLITFLGLPLITSRLSKSDCMVLVNKICQRISCWTSYIFLSYAGRLLVIKSVLFAMQSYWASFMFLPNSVLKILQSTLARFLWAGNAEKCHHKISWIQC